MLLTIFGYVAKGEVGEYFLFCREGGLDENAAGWFGSYFFMRSRSSKEMNLFCQWHRFNSFFVQSPGLSSFKVFANAVLQGIRGPVCTQTSRFFR